MTSDDLLGLPGYADAVPVATGGSSTVWRAREVAFDRLVAVKVLSRPVLDDGDRRRFERELAMTGRLSGHPHVLTVHSRGFTADGRPYLTSDWCPAGSLADVVARTGPLTAAQTAWVGVRIAQALEAAHESGVVHRDVKPQNVFVTAYGQPALADFGIALVSAETTTPTDSLTPAHAAPEVLQGGTAEAAADVWGLGSTLWTLLAGAPPYAAKPGEGVLPVMLRILNDPLPDDPDPVLGPVLRRLLDKDAPSRPTAAEAGALLRPHAEGAAPLPAAPPMATVLPTAALAGQPAGPVTTPPADRTAPRGSSEPGPATTPASAAQVVPLLPATAATGRPSGVAETTVHRPDRPAPPDADDAQPGRRRSPLLLAGALTLVLALVAGVAVLLARGGEEVVLADSSSVGGAGATVAPSAGPDDAGDSEPGAGPEPGAAPADPVDGETGPGPGLLVDAPPGGAGGVGAAVGSSAVDDVAPNDGSVGAAPAQPGPAGAPPGAAPPPPAAQPAPPPAQPAATAPGVPRNLAVRAGDGVLVLSWAPPASDGGATITGYDLTLGGAAVGSVSGSARTATVAARNDAQHTVTVAARNGAGAGPAASGTGTPRAPQPHRFPVYRCQSAAGDQLYTTNSSCKGGYDVVGKAWEVTKDEGVPGTTPLWRLYHPGNRIHLVTWDGAERQRLIGSGWQADGQMGWVRTSPAHGWTKITRFHNGRQYAYSNDASVHVWTNRGYKVEGVFYS